jgi:hypothetical protein
MNESTWQEKEDKLHVHPVFGEVCPVEPREGETSIQFWGCYPASVPDTNKPCHQTESLETAKDWVEAYESLLAKNPKITPAEIQFLKKITGGNCMLKNGEPTPRITALMKRGYCYICPVRSGPLGIFTGEQFVLITEAGFKFLALQITLEQNTQKEIEEQESAQQEFNAVEELKSMFFCTHSMNVAEAVANWVHTPDCSPPARTLIREAAAVNGSTRENPDAIRGFKCPICCDAGRIAVGEPGKKEWQDCPHPIEEPTT